ncbi:hypothetical protein B0H14DRAFT_3168622 [Mycena olivaceomarginata]|nr:hypothetical protein B0H14DRAFT_3168622 [Mycena olivaceomarginata]
MSANIRRSMQAAAALPESTCWLLEAYALYRILSALYHDFTSPWRYLRGALVLWELEGIDEEDDGFEEIWWQQYGRTFKVQLRFIMHKQQVCRKNPDQLQTSRDASQDAARSYGLSGLQHTAINQVVVLGRRPPVKYKELILEFCI